jgi:hypothetical protein
MSMMRIEIEANTYFTALAVLRERQNIRPDVRVVGALVDLHAAALKEVDRELAAVSEPERVPAFLRRQAD